MRLSEAIRLGSLLVEKPAAGNINACAITQCEGCPAQKGAVNRWWVALVEQDHLRIYPWDEEVARVEHITHHFCELECLLRWAGKCLQDVYGGERH